MTGPDFRRRWDDTGPIELEPITESDWTKLTEAERQDLLLHRHHQVIEGQARIWRRLDTHGKAVDAAVLEARLLAQRLDNQVLPMLAENTTATKEAAAAAEKVAELFATFSAKAESLMEAWTATQGFGKVVGWVGDKVKGIAWIAIPAGVALGAWQAAIAWLKTGGHWPFK